MARITGGRNRLEPANYLLMHQDEFFAWLESNNEKARQPKKGKWNNGEKTEQMGGFSEFINW